MTLQLLEVNRKLELKLHSLFYAPKHQRNVSISQVYTVNTHNYIDAKLMSVNWMTPFSHIKTKSRKEKAVILLLNILFGHLSWACTSTHTHIFTYNRMAFCVCRFRCARPGLKNCYWIWHPSLQIDWTE